MMEWMEIANLGLTIFSGFIATVVTSQDENLEISVINTAEEPASELLSSSNTGNKGCIRVQGWLRDTLNIDCLNLATTKLLVLLLFCGSLYGVLNESALPGSEMFALIALELASFIGGQILKLIKLPPLVGMLIVGFLFRNVSYTKKFSEDISPSTASTIRNIALVIILLSAGVGLDGKKLNKMKRVVVQLTCIPLLVEVVSMTLFAHYLLELPWSWGLMLGFIVSAVSIAVVLPILQKLRKSGLGNDKGIPTLVLAASSIDDIVAIAGFTITLGIVFANGSLTWILIKTPLEPLVGCAFGAVLGVSFWFFPHKDASLGVFYRVMLLIFGGTSLMFVSGRLGMAGSGALACVTLSFVASLGWRKQDSKQFLHIEIAIRILWKLIEPVMFALIGKEVSIKNLYNHTGYSILSIFLALLCRSLVTPFVTFGAKLNLKEKIFVSCAWLPKAAVQAAIGSQALDYARQNRSTGEFIGYGEQILTVSVLSIVITAPVGAALTSLLGPVLLAKDSSPEEINNYGSFCTDANIL